MPTLIIPEEGAKFLTKKEQDEQNQKNNRPPLDSIFKTDTDRPSLDSIFQNSQKRPSLDSIFKGASSDNPELPGELKKTSVDIKGPEIKASPTFLGIPGTENVASNLRATSEVFTRFLSGQLRGVTLGGIDSMPPNPITRRPIPEEAIKKSPELKKYSFSEILGDLSGFLIPASITSAGMGAMGVIDAAANAFGTGAILGAARESANELSHPEMKLSLPEIFQRLGEQAGTDALSFLAFEKGGELANKVIPHLFKETSKTVEPLVKMTIHPEDLESFVKMRGDKTEVGQFLSKFGNLPEIFRTIRKTKQPYEFIMPERVITTIKDRPWFAGFKEAFNLEPANAKTMVETKGMKMYQPVAGGKTTVLPEKPEHIKNAEKVGKVIGIDADTKLPVIDTKTPTIDYEGMVAQAGGEFKGIQKGFTKKSGEIVPDQLMFNGPSGTYSLSVDKASPESIKAKIDEGEKRFAEKRAINATESGQIEPPVTPVEKSVSLPENTPKEPKTVKKAIIKTPFKMELSDFESQAISDVFGEDAHNAILDELSSQVSQGEAGKRIRTEEGDWKGIPSSFPKWFQNKGYTKKGTLAIIEKVRKGEPITQKQHAVMSDLLNGMIHDEVNRYERSKTKISQEDQGTSGVSSELPKELPEDIPQELSDEIDRLSAEHLKSLAPGVDPTMPTTPLKPKVDQKEIDMMGERERAVGEAAKKQGSFFEPAQRYGKSQNELGFYSDVEKSVLEKLPNSANPEQIKNTIKNTPGVKQEEIEFLGLDEFLQGKLKVSKQELLDFIRSNNVQIQEVRKGEDLERNSDFKNFSDSIKSKYGVTNVYDALDRDLLTTEEARTLSSLDTRYKEQPKFENYQLSGGENYREVLLTLPTKPPEEGMQSNRANFISGHWDEPNVLAHFRLNDRTIDGKKTLFIEEIQSDWHQKGRSEGYGSKLPEELSSLKEIPKDQLTQDQKDRLLALENNLALPIGPPNAPFKKTWHELALKRILRMAAEEGYDSISWTTGKIQELRYPGQSIIGNEAWIEITKPDSSRKLFDDFFGGKSPSDFNLDIVQSSMLPLLKHDQISKRVIELLPVDVVNALSENGFTAKQLISNPSMVFNSVSVDTRSSITKGIGNALAKVRAELRATLDSALSAGRDEELLGTLKASDLDHREVVRLLSPVTLTDFSGDVGGRSGGTGSATKFSISGKNDSGESLKLSSAKLAEFLNRHEGIITGNPSKAIEKFRAGVDGMKLFYDQIIPSFLNKYTKKWGGRVGEGEIEVTNTKAREGENLSAEEARFEREVSQGQKVHILNITPAMKSALVQGQALFEPSQLYLPGMDAKGNPSSESDIAYGSKEDQAKRIDEVIQQIRIKYTAQNVRRARIVEELQTVGYINYAGRKVSGPDELAQLHQVFRSPAIETFSYYVIKPDGTVHSNQNLSSGVLDQVMIGNEFFERIASDILDSGVGSKLYIAHNHPSGRAQPSIEDRSMTAKILRMFPKSFSGHIIIDHGKYFFMDGLGYFETRDYDVNPKMSWVIERGNAIKDPDSLASFFHDVLRGARTLHVPFVDKSNSIVAYSLMNPFELGKNLFREIMNAKKRYAATGYFVMGDEETIKHISEQNLVYPEGLLDQVTVLMSGYRSAMESGEVKRIFTNVSGVFEPGEEYGINPFDESQENLDNSEPEDVQKERKEFKLFERSKEIIQKYAERVGERFVPRGNQGMFFPKTNNIRLQALNNLSTVVHEVTHYLDKKYKLVQNVIGATTRGDATRKELTRMYTDHYPTGKKEHKLRIRMAEGIATLFERYVEDPKMTVAEYPRIVNQFITPGGKFNKPEFNEFLTDAKSVLEDFTGLDPTAKIMARMADAKSKIKDKNLLSWSERFNTFIADAIYPVEKLAQGAGVGMTRNDPSLWLRQYKNSAGMILNNIKGEKGYWSLRNGEFKKIYDFNWKTLADKLHTAGTRDLFNAWLVARREHFGYQKLDELEKTLRELAAHSKEIQESGDPEAMKEFIASIKAHSDAFKQLSEVLAKDNFSKEDVAQVYNEHKDRFQDEAKMFDDLIRSDLELLADPAVQLVTPDQFSSLSQNEGYATFKRDVYDDILGEGGIAFQQPKVGGVKASSMMTRTGSELSILDVMYSSIHNHAEIFRKAMKQIVWNKMLPVAEKFPELFQVVPLKVHVDEKTGMISFPQARSLSESIIMARKDYKRVPIQTDKGVKKVLDDVLTYKNVDLARELIITSSRIFTRGTTGSFPPFAIANFMVDQISASAQTRNKYVPIYDALNILSKAISEKDSPESAFATEYMMLGGERQTFVGWQDMQPDELFRKISTEKAGLERFLDWIDKGYEFLAIPAKYSEIATRMTEYIKSRLSGKDQLTALEEAGRVTAPFHHMGSWGGSELAITWIKAIPFSSASIQVLAEYASALGDPKRRQRAFAVVAAVTASLVAAFAGIMLYGDDDDRMIYKQLEPRELAKYIFTPNPFGKGLLKFRIPDQMGTFGVLVNMFLAQKLMGANYKMENFIDAATAWIPDQFDITDPIRLSVSWLPQLIKPYLEAMVFEKKTFPAVRPIESQGLQNKEPRARYYDTTSTLAKYLGNVLNFSPIKIDYLIEGYSGRVARLITGKNNQLPIAALGEMTRTTLVRDMYFTAGRNILDFYDKKNETIEKYNALKTKSRNFSKQESDQVLRNRYLIFGHEDFKGIDGMLRMYRASEKDKTFTDTKKATQLRSSILNLIAQLK
jgi:hypothetical protein